VPAGLGAASGGVRRPDGVALRPRALEAEDRAVELQDVVVPPARPGPMPVDVGRNGEGPATHLVADRPEYPIASVRPAAIELAVATVPETPGRLRVQTEPAGVADLAAEPLIRAHVAAAAHEEEVRMGEEPLHRGAEAELRLYMLRHNRGQGFGLRCRPLPALQPGRAVLLDDLVRLARILVRPHLDTVELEMPGKVVRAAVLNLVQEEGLLVGVPTGLAVMDFAVGAADVRPDQRHASGVPLRRLKIWQERQHLLPDPLGILQELLGDVLASYDHLLGLRGNGSLVCHSVLELASPPEHACLPMARKPADGLLHDKLRTVNVQREVLVDDLWAPFACFHGVPDKSQRPTVE